MSLYPVSSSCVISYEGANPSSIVYRWNFICKHLTTIAVAVTNLCFRAPVRDICPSMKRNDSFSLGPDGLQCCKSINGPMSVLPSSMGVSH